MVSSVYVKQPDGQSSSPPRQNAISGLRSLAGNYNGIWRTFGIAIPAAAG
jgi:hypothetical protein